MEKQQRRASAEAGKRNFRSKRFSRNMERPGGQEPPLRRSHSLHGQQRLRDIRDDDVDDDEAMDWPRRRRRPSESSDAAAVSAEATAAKGPGGIGSYLARQEFGSNDGQAGGGHPGGAAAPADSSGYVSHGSGGYPKLQLPVSSACKLLKALIRQRH